MGSNTDFLDWKPFTKHLDDNPAGQFLGTHSTLIIATVPRFEDLGVTPDFAALSARTGVNNKLFPIALCQDFALDQAKAQTRIFEIGTYRSYFLPGRERPTVQFSQVMYHGPTLMRSLYNIYASENNGNGSASHGALDPNIQGHKPGSNGDAWMNMSSDITNRPIGLLIYFRDSLSDGYASIFLQDVYLDRLHISFQSAPVAIGQTITAQYDVMIPISLPTAAENASN